MRRVFLSTLLILTAALLVAGCECPPEDDVVIDMGGRDRQTVSTCNPISNTHANMYLPTGREAGSVVYVDKMGPEQVIAGTEYTYEIKVKNITDQPLQNVQVTEDLPEGFRLVSTSPQAQQQQNRLTWNMAQLAADETRSVKVTGIAPDTGSYRSCTDVTWRPPMLCLDTQVIKPALAVNLEAPQQNILCDPLTYTVTVRNTGSGAACNVRVNMELPQGLTTLDGNRTVSRTIDQIDAGESERFTVQVKADDKGSFQTQAVATADGNLRATSEQVGTEIVTPVLVVTKEGPNVRFVDQPITYTVTVSNTGDFPARNTVLREELAQGVKYIKSTGNGRKDGNEVVWDLGTVPVGGSKQVEVTVTPTQKGHITMVAKANAYCASGQERTATIIQGIPAILLETVDERDPIRVTENEVYTITVTNQGSEAARNVQIQAILPDEMEFVSADAPGEESVQGKNITFAAVPTIEPKEKAVFKITARGLRPGDAHIKVQMTSSLTTRPVYETESTHVYE